MSDQIKSDENNLFEESFLRQNPEEYKNKETTGYRRKSYNKNKGSENNGHKYGKKANIKNVYSMDCEKQERSYKIEKHRSNANYNDMKNRSCPNFTENREDHKNERINYSQTKCKSSFDENSKNIDKKYNLRNQKNEETFYRSSQGVNHNSGEKIRTISRGRGRFRGPEARPSNNFPSNIIFFQSENDHIGKIESDSYLNLQCNASLENPITSNHLQNRGRGRFISIDKSPQVNYYNVNDESHCSKSLSVGLELGKNKKVSPIDKKEYSKKSRRLSYENPYYTSPTKKSIHEHCGDESKINLKDTNVTNFLKKNEGLLRKSWQKQSILDTLNFNSRKDKTRLVENVTKTTENSPLNSLQRHEISNSNDFENTPKRRSKHYHTSLNFDAKSDPYTINKFKNEDLSKKYNTEDFQRNNDDCDEEKIHVNSREKSKNNILNRSVEFPKKNNNFQNKWRRYSEPKYSTKRYFNQSYNSNSSLTLNDSWSNEDFNELDDDYKEWRNNIWDYTDINAKTEERFQDLFTLPQDYSLAHCVAEDLSMGSGIAVEFKKKFKNVGKLMDQNQKSGGLAVLEHDNRFIYYLVTKRKSHDKPTYYTFWQSLIKLREHIQNNNVKKLGIPTLGCGLDRLDWSKIKSMIEYVFKDTPIEILVCVFQQDESNSPFSSKTKYHKCNIVYPEYAIDQIETGTIILYFSTQDGHVADDMKTLSKKFNFTESFNKAKKELGDVVQYSRADKNYILFGCIVRQNINQNFNFTHLQNCLNRVAKFNSKEKYEYVAFQEIEDEGGDMINEKVLSLLKNSLKFVDIYCCKATIL